jgi:hypothetical protein
MRDFAIQLFFRAIKDWRTYSGIIALVFAVTGSAVGHSILLPTWLWWAAAVLSFAVIAIRAEWKLYQDSMSVVSPDMRLDIALKLIIGSEELRAQENARKVIEALLILREKSHLGLLSVWGRRVLQDGRQNIRTPIPPEYWECFIIKYVEYGRLSEYIYSAIGETSRESGNPSYEEDTIYRDIYFCSHPVRKVWPKPKKSLAFAWPVRLINR